MADAPERTPPVDFSQVRRRTHKEVNYWLDQALLRIAALEQERDIFRAAIREKDDALYLAASALVTCGRPEAARYARETAALTQPEGEKP